MKSGAMTSVIVARSFTRTWSEGPAVSLNGSPTVSPTTAAACASDPLPRTFPCSSLRWPDSMYFLALCAWDNAKKYIESGHLKDEHGNVLGKGSDAHAAAVVGDTVGDPFKDTAGPSLHVLVKLLATITLVMAPLFIR